MGKLSTEDKGKIKSAIAKVLTTGLAGSDVKTSRVIADEIEYAKKKVDGKLWTEKRAQQHVRFAIRASASIYASQKQLKQLETRAAMLDLINTLGGVLNGVIGFDLLPVPK